MEQQQQQQHLHQQLNHQYQTQHRLGQSLNSPQPQEIPASLKPTSDQDSYKETLTSKKQNVVKARSLNTNLIRTKAISKCFKVFHQRGNKQHYECKTYGVYILFISYN